MKFSLILCTLNRKEELMELFISLTNQSYKNFEIILVDQNESDILKDLVKKFEKTLSIVHIKSEKGLSKSRNLGIKYAKGDILAFPDDDCIYEKNILSEVNSILTTTVYDFISCNTKDKNKEESIVKMPQIESIMNGDIYKIIGVSITLFFKSNLIRSVGNFDEELGVGAGTIYGAGEETDYLIRALKKGFIGIYKPNLFIYHPAKETIYDRETCARSKLYGGGTGKIARRYYNNYYKIRILLVPLIKLLLSIPRINKMNYYYQNFLGRWKGFLF